LNRGRRRDGVPEIQELAGGGVTREVEKKKGGNSNCVEKWTGRWGSREKLEKGFFLNGGRGLALCRKKKILLVFSEGVPTQVILDDGRGPQGRKKGGGGRL